MTKKATEIFTPLKDKSVLVTGSAGYIGSELMKRFHTQDIRCLGIDKSNVDGSGELRFNLCDRNRTLEVFDEFSPDYVIHCGTHSAVAYRQRFLESFEEDACAMSNILHALTGRPGTRLMLLSSSYVYSGLEPETAFTKPTRCGPRTTSVWQSRSSNNTPCAIIRAV